MLTEHSKEIFNRRASNGVEIIQRTWKSTELNSDDEDFDTAAKDAISDILTAVFGPAGKLVAAPDRTNGCKVELDDAACDNARALVSAALASYFGDAEDYIEEASSELADVDIVVVRDPDASNDINVVGGEANVVDIDLGRFDLGNTDEWNDWQESRRLDLELVASDKARWIIADTVRTAAENWGHEVPAWAAVACYVNA